MKWHREPYILVIWGDDIGRTNISTYTAYTIDQVMEKLQTSGGSK